MAKTKVQGKSVAVVGYGVEGRSAAKWLQAQGAAVTVLDKSPLIETEASLKLRGGPDYLQNLDDFDLIVRSPGVHPKLLSTKRPITSSTQLFLENCLAPVIGVTGTKGKGTTASLISKMLENVGQEVALGGNIGLPALDLLDQARPESWVVLEMSSFQLYDLNLSPHIAVILKIEPEHLDWHQDMADYVAAKSRIASYQTKSDSVIYYADNEFARSIAEQSLGSKLPYFAPPGAYIDAGQILINGTIICAVKEVGLTGPHNLENICAALTTVWSIYPDPAALAAAIKEFKGLEHRLEFAGESKDVQYFNDSFATTPSAAVAALESFDKQIVMIAGGASKNSDFTPLIEEIITKPVKKVLLIGQTAQQMADMLLAKGYSDYQLLGEKVSMQQVVNQAAQSAASGDIVLLSPACASFGMFENYKQRGNLFKNAVKSL